MKRPVLALLLLILAAPAFAADVHVTVKTHTDPMTVMGQATPARDDVQELWISSSKMAMVTKERASVVDLDKNMMYIVNHGDKSYVETALPVDFAKLLPPEAASMAAMMQMKVTVTPGAETKKIGAWDCTSYDATMNMMGMTLKMKIWATTQVPFDLAAFTAKMLPAVMQSQMAMDVASVKEFAKIKGYQIATETTGDVMGAKMRTTTEVVDIVQKAAPAGLHEPPAGYTREGHAEHEGLAATVTRIGGARQGVPSPRAGRRGKPDVRRHGLSATGPAEYAQPRARTCSRAGPARQTGQFPPRPAKTRRSARA